MEDVWGYMDLVNKQSANDFLDDLYEKINSLLEMPFMGVKRNEYFDGVRVVFYQKYNIYYLVENKTILILRILHGSRDIKSLLP